MRKEEVNKHLSAIYIWGLVVVLSGCITYPPSVDAEQFFLPAYDETACIIHYNGYTVSYDENTRLPVWVAYELTSEETDGPAKSAGKNFVSDDKIRKIQADSNDYRHSGWSRGHMAPAGDFKWDESAMVDTFYYTNCCPQNETLNQGSWNGLERRVRSWAKQFGNIFVVTGPIVGENKMGRIGAHGIVVPDAFFKALLISREGSYKGIAFVATNDSHKQKASDIWISINDLEDITGIDFFPSLDDSIEEIVEDSVEPFLWGIQ